jgi:hypothetical protein
MIGKRSNNSPTGRDPARHVLSDVKVMLLALFDQWGLVQGRAISQAVVRRPLTAKAWSGFAPRAVCLGFVVDEVTLGQVSLRDFRLYAVNIILPLIHIHSCITWRMDNIFTECRGWVVNNTASHSEGPGFKSRPGDRTFWLRVFVVLLMPSIRML